MDMMLKGRTAIVTGGGKGVGAGISRQLAAEGVNVLINCNSNQDMAENTAAQIREAGGNAFVYRADVSDREQVDAMIRKTVELYGGLDIVVNNAAWQPNLDIDEYTEEFFDGIMNINYGGYFRCMQAALPYLKQSKCPRVINISSVHGKRPTDFDVGYSMAKGAIKMLTREAAIELAEFGITVNAILPGAVKIEFKSGYTTPFKARRLQRDRKYNFFPLGRVATPDDVGELVVFLASERGSYITGASIRLDGGSMLL
jgi:NAD(P)-dependent dehydrogenase (short-subunit alcohol dehydrogenase family)